MYYKNPIRTNTSFIQAIKDCLVDPDNRVMRHADWSAFCSVQLVNNVFTPLKNGMPSSTPMQIGSELLDSGWFVYSVQKNFQYWLARSVSVRMRDAGCGLLLVVPGHPPMHFNVEGSLVVRRELEA